MDGGGAKKVRKEVHSGCLCVLPDRCVVHSLEYYCDAVALAARTNRRYVRSFMG